MLSEVEKNGIRSLLERLEKPDLISLTDTVTNRAVTVDTSEDAIEAIISFTVNTKVLLRRKKVRREHVFQYLAEHQVFVPSTADKQQLIKKVMDLWVQKERELKLGCSMDPSLNYSDPSVSSTSHTPSMIDSKSYLETSIEPASSTTSPGHSPNTSPSSTVCSSGPLHGKGDSESDNFGQSLAEQWAPWFYDLLKSCSVNMINDPSQPHGMSDWGEHHFWADSRLNIEVTAGTNTTEESYSGAASVSARLYSMVVRESIYLNPNLDKSGINGKLDLRGIVIITVSGTVHRSSHYVGLFEQAFGLLKDPSVNNNYRIKFTHLRLRSLDHLPGTQSQYIATPSHPYSFNTTGMGSPNSVGTPPQSNNSTPSPQGVTWR